LWLAVLLAAGSARVCTARLQGERKEACMHNNKNNKNLTQKNTPFDLLVLCQRKENEFPSPPQKKTLSVSLFLPLVDFLDHLFCSSLLCSDMRLLAVLLLVATWAFVSLCIFDGN
jgi:hypothetical protein